MGGRRLVLQQRADHLDPPLPAREHLPARQGERGVLRVVAGEHTAPVDGGAVVGLDEERIVATFREKAYALRDRSLGG